MQNTVPRGGAGRCLPTSRRCTICGKRHAMPREDVRLAWCEGVLRHRARLVPALAVDVRERVAA